MNLQDVKYENHRTIWKSPAFLRSFFGIKKDQDPYKNPRVKNFLYKLQDVPVQEIYSFVGYGSIMNEKDVPRTLETASNHRLGILNGFRRTFNVGFETAYMNVQEDELSSLNVAIMEFKYWELPRLINREFLYDFMTVKVKNGDKIIENALMVIGEEDFVDDTLDPQLNYLHLCMSGAKNLNGLEGINNFLDYTYCYCHKSHRQIEVREYLKNLDLTNYMIKNEYSSR